MEKVEKEGLYTYERVEAGEKWSSGASKHCFQYLIQVYQLLISPMIGQL